MKTVRKIFFISVAVMSLTTLSFTSSNGKSDNTGSTSEECYSCRYDQCHAIAKSTGQRCKHCVSNYGDTYCWQH